MRQNDSYMLTEKLDKSESQTSSSEVPLWSTAVAGATFRPRVESPNEPMPQPKMLRWADEIPPDEDDGEIFYYDTLQAAWHDKLVSNVSKTTGGLIRVKLPKGLETIPFVLNLSNAMKEHSIVTYWDPSVQVTSDPELTIALQDDGPKLGIYVDKLFNAIQTADTQASYRSRTEKRILEGLFTLRELRAVMRNFHHKYVGSLEGKPPSVEWTMKLRLETLWEAYSGEERRVIHNLISSHPDKGKVKYALSALFGEEAAGQLVDGYEIAFRHMIRNVLDLCNSEENRPIAQKMHNWFNANIASRLPTHWEILMTGYQLTKVTVPLTAAEKQRVAETKFSFKEKKEYLDSKPTKIVNRRLLPIIDTSLLVTVEAKKTVNAWNNAYETLKKTESTKMVDPNRMHQLKTLMRNVSEMRKFTLDIFYVFRKHSKSLRDEVFQKIRSEKSGNRRNAEKTVITAYEFNSELQKRRPDLDTKERNLLIDICAYIPTISISDIDSKDVSSLESKILEYLSSRFENSLYTTTV